MEGIVGLEPFAAKFNILSLIQLRAVNRYCKWAVESHNTLWQQHYCEIFGSTVGTHLNWCYEFIYRNNTRILMFDSTNLTTKGFIDEPQIAQIDYLQGFFIRDSNNVSYLAAPDMTVMKEDIVKMAIGPQYRFLLSSDGRVWLPNFDFDQNTLELTDVVCSSEREAVDVAVGASFGAVLRSNNHLNILCDRPQIISDQLTNDIVQMVARGNHLACVNTSGQLFLAYLSFEPGDTSFSIEESSFTDVKMMALGPNNLFILDHEGFLWAIYFDEKVRRLTQPIPVCPIEFSRIISGSHAMVIATDRTADVARGSDITGRGIIAIDRQAKAYYIVDEDVQPIETPDYNVFDGCVNGSTIHLVAVPKVVEYD